jgi:phospholipid transport system substrate-binding protein
MKNWIFVFLLTCAAGLHANPDPVIELQGAVASAVEALFGEGSEAKTVDAKRAAVRAAFEANYNMDIIIRRAIGGNWRRLSAGEQSQILELIKEVVLKAYIDGMKGKSRPEIRYGEAVKNGENRLEIPSIVTMEDRTVHLKYKLARVRSGWELYDLVAEEISLVSNYRQQFDDHFRRGNATELIKKLEELLNHEKLDHKVTL